MDDINKETNINIIKKELQNSSNPTKEQWQTKTKHGNH